MLSITGELLANGNIKYTFYCLNCDEELSYINILPPVFCFICSQKQYDIDQLLKRRPSDRLLYHAGWGPP